MHIFRRVKMLLICDMTPCTLVNKNQVSDCSNNYKLHSAIWPQKKYAPLRKDTCMN